MPSRWRFMAAQVGRKPGAQESLARLLTVDDLRGRGWRRLDERTWRTGRQAPDQPWAANAAAAGTVTAWRSFGSGNRYLWVQVSPLTGSEDARAMVRQAPGLMLKNMHATVAVAEETDVVAPAIPGVTDSWAHEQRTDGNDGPGLSLLLAFACGSDLVATGASGIPTWSWTELAELMTTQAQRLDH